MKKILAAVLCAVLLTAFMSGCADEGKILRIGVVEPLTGSSENGGNLELNGIMLAYKHRKEVIGKNIKLVKTDIKSDVIIARNNTEQLVDSKNVVAVIGPWGSKYAYQVGEILLKSEVPGIAPSCTNPEVTRNNDYYFRTVFTDDFQGEVAANFAYTNLGAPKMAIIVDRTNDYCKGATEIFKQVYIKLMGSYSEAFATVQYIELSTRSYTDILTAIQESGAEAVYMPGAATKMSNVIKEARAMGIDVDFIGGDTWENENFVNNGGEAVEGAYLTTLFYPELNEKTKAFVEAYRKEYGEMPTSAAALAYDSYMLLLDAIDRAGTVDLEIIRDCIAETDGYVGVTGTFNFDEFGDAIKECVVLQVVDGKFTYVTTIDK